MTRTWVPGSADAALSALAAAPRLLVALDFDGTCAPLVDDPMAARALPETAEAVARLAALPDTVVAFVSGRSLEDLRVIAEHDDDSPIVLAASHGAEYWHPGEGSSSVAEIDLAERDALGESVHRLVRHLPGIGFEPKSLGFGIHARLATEDVEDDAFALVDALMAERAPHWRRRRGHNILEYAATDAGKDAAVSRLRAWADVQAVLFAGDDVTDEDAMRALLPSDLGVRVGAGETAAARRVEDPQLFARLLHALATERGARGE